MSGATFSQDLSRTNVAALPGDPIPPRAQDPLAKPNTSRSRRSARTSRMSRPLTSLMHPSVVPKSPTVALANNPDSPSLLRPIDQPKVPNVPDKRGRLPVNRQNERRERLERHEMGIADYETWICERMRAANGALDERAEVVNELLERCHNVASEMVQMEQGERRLREQGFMRASDVEAQWVESLGWRPQGRR